MCLVPDHEQPTTDPAPKPAVKIKEPAEVVAFIDHYLALADVLLAPNVEKLRPEEKSEPYAAHHKK